MYPKTVREAHVTSDELDLTVSTVQIAPNYYDTVIFDNHEDNRHHGKHLAEHEWEGRKYGPYVIGKTNERAATREAAMNDHREALYAARTEQPR